MVGTCPCRDCKNRNAICHSDCGKYKEWRKNYDAEMKEAKKRNVSHSEKYYKKLGE